MVTFVADTTGVINATTANTATTTTITSSQASVPYGTAVTFTATVSATSGTTAPSQGNVDFFDVTANKDLGNGTFGSSTGNASVWTFLTAAKTFNVTTGDVIKATYTPGSGFLGSDSGASNNVTQIVTAQPITVTAATNTKGYDGTTTAAAAPTITGTVVSGDTPNFTESYDTKNAGTGKTLTATGVVNDGNGGNNYAVTFVADTSGAITARAITVTAATNTKGYDGTTNAAATPTITAGTLATGDTANFTETYDTKNAGTGKTLTANGVVNDGNGGNNYAMTFLADTTGVIDPLGITGSIRAGNKIYDASSAATITARSLTGVLGLDDVQYVGGTATFSDKNVGTGKTVTAIGLSLAGADAGNYTVNGTATANADITRRPLTVSTSGQDKAYDGTTVAAVTLSDNRIAGDVFTDTYASAAFADKNVGVNKPISVSGIAISGTDAGNYQLTATTATTAADIATAPLSKFVVSVLSSGTVVAGDPVLFTVQGVDQVGDAIGGPTSISLAGSPGDTVSTIPSSVSLNSSGFGFFVAVFKTAGAHDHCHGHARHRHRRQPTGHRYARERRLFHGRRLHRPRSPALLSSSP